MNRVIDILHIEDADADVAMILHELSKYWPQINHHRVERLSELKEALEKKWDVILSDFSLPEFDGLTALRMVRENEINTPFIVVSGRVEEDIAASMMRLGANDYVMKDNLKRLSPAIERELKTAESGFRSTGSMKYQSAVAAPDESLTVSQAGSAETNAEFIKERHKAVVNILCAANIIRKAQQTILQREDLTEPQFNVLSILRRQAPNVVTITAIKDEVSNKTSDISRMVDKMVKSGLVSYSVNQQDKRVRDISITQQGMNALTELDKVADEMFLCDALLSNENAARINEGLQPMLAIMLDC